MAQVEPMDIDSVDSDFDNKENTYHHGNVQSRSPCTEKGYEELDISELNMKLRYSFTPASSPMSKSLTGCLDNRNCNHGEDFLNAAATDNGNLTRSLNSTFSKTDSMKSKTLPLQTLSSDPTVDSNRNSTHRLIEPDNNNITISVCTNDVDDNLSLPSTSSSMAQTPEATTPTKEIPKPEGSPILRGLKSVLSMFRSSQSPIPPADDKTPNPGNTLNCTETNLSIHVNVSDSESVQASTPMNVGKQKESNASKRSSPLKESLVFKDDLERELQWKDETQITFKQEKIPIAKLLIQDTTSVNSKYVVTEELNATTEYMDISCNESVLANKATDIEQSCNKNEAAAVESDNEFLDCETTFSKNEIGISDIQDTVVEEKNISSNVTAPTSEFVEDLEIKNKIKTINLEPDNVNIESNIDTLPAISNFELENNYREIIEVTTNFLQNETCSNIKGLNEEILMYHNMQQNELNVTDNYSQIDKTLVQSLNTNEDNLSDLNMIPSVKHPGTEVITNKGGDIMSVINNKIEILGAFGPLTTNNKTENNITSLLSNEEVCDSDNFNLNNVSNSNVNNDLMHVSATDQEEILSNIKSSQMHLELNEELTEVIQISAHKSIIEEEGYSGAEVINFETNEKKIMKSAEKEEFGTKNSLDMTKRNLPSTQSHLGLLQNFDTVDNEVKKVEANDKSYDTSINNFASLDKDSEVSELAVANSAIGKLPLETPLPNDDDDIDESPNNETSKLTEEVTITPNVILETNIFNSSIKLKEFEHEHGIPTVTYENNDLLVTDNFQTSEAENCSTQLKSEKNKENEIKLLEEDNNKNDAEKCLSEIISPVSVSEIQKAEIDNSSKQSFDVLIEPQKIISIKTDDTEKLSTQYVCDTTSLSRCLPTGNENSVSNYKTESGVVPFISQEDITRNLVKAAKLESQISCFDQNIVEINEDNSKNNNQDMGVREMDEEIITSANNSPYVSVTELPLDVEPHPVDHIKGIDEHAFAQNKIAESPPISPKIVSKGYNFNFDDIEDPFATKTKIRMSPTADSPNQSINLGEEPKKAEEVPKKIINNRRKSQPDRKKLTQKKTFNSRVVGNTLSDENSSKKNNKKPNKIPSEDNTAITTKLQDSSYLTKPEESETVVNKIEENLGETENISTQQNVESVTEDVRLTDGEAKCMEQTLVISDHKSTSSSEQYFSLGTSSGESVGIMNRSKNVFNIPEIDDINFNPFSTKSKMRMSPPPSERDVSEIQGANNAVTNSTYVQQSDRREADTTFDKTTTQDSSPNASNVTSSSKSTNDKNATVRETLTEDEDTIEGPFLEADDLKHTGKPNDIDVAKDMMNFDEVPTFPTQEIDENIDNGELFIDADAFEFLLNQNKSATVSDSGKESLFLKFDPLFANRVSSDGVLTALSKIQKRQSTPKKLVTKQIPKDISSANIPVAGPSNERENNIPVAIEDYSDDLSSYAVNKPMMVVNPAVSSTMSQRKVVVTPKINRRSLTFTSPAMAVIDRLLSLSGNAPHLNDDTSSFNMSREHNETDFAITQLRELLAEKEIHVHNLRCESKELKDRLAALEVQVRSLETESAERLMKINDLNDRLSEKTKINKSMATVVEEYERTIASLIAESEQDKKRHAEERLRLIRERDEQTAHLTSMEVSFSDLHSKYEKSKQIILTCKANEDTYKKSIQEFEENFSKMQTNYELLKQHATSKLNHANQELEKMNRAHEAEVLKLNALIKRKELDITSLEESLSQKTKANEELTAICDELINKVG